VYANTDGTGDYAFEVWQVPAPQSFNIAVGDTVSADVPGPGAGEIDTVGAVDLYTFSLVAPAHLQLTAKGECTNTDLAWSLLDSTGTPINNDANYSDTAACFDLGGFELPAGQYTIRVAAHFDGTGTYSFQITQT
jgi:hypothetical protein